MNTVTIKNETTGMTLLALHIENDKDFSDIPKFTSNTEVRSDPIHSSDRIEPMIGDYIVHLPGFVMPPRIDGRYELWTSEYLKGLGWKVTN